MNSYFSIKMKRTLDSFTHVLFTLSGSTSGPMTSGLLRRLRHSVSFRFILFKMALAFRLSDDRHCSVKINLKILNLRYQNSLLIKLDIFRQQSHQCPQTKRNCKLRAGMSSESKRDPFWSLKQKQYVIETGY